MAYKVPERLYRTTDGRLVRHGDRDAAFLAFLNGQELTDQQAKQQGLLEWEKTQKAAQMLAEQPRADEPDEKQRVVEPQDKAAPQPADKGVAKGPRRAPGSRSSG